MTATRERIRRILGTLPETEIKSGGERDQHLGVSVRNKRFAWYLDDHHGDGVVAITCKAPDGINVSMVASDPPFDPTEAMMSLSASRSEYRMLRY